MALPQIHAPELALFSPTNVESGIESTEWVEFRPVGQIGEGGALEFNIPGNSLTYVDLKRTRLRLKGKITESNGNGVPAYNWDTPRVDQRNALVAPINLFLHSMWSQVDVSLQQQVITKLGANAYAYKAYFDALFETSSDAKTSQMESELYFKDRTVVTDKGLDAMGAGFTQNIGATSRFLVTGNSKAFDMEGPLYMDICQQNRFILNGVPVNVKLWPNNDRFRLMTEAEGKEYTMNITEAVLKVCMVKVSPGVLLGHAEALKKSPAIYPLTKSVVKTFTIPKGQFSFTADDLFQGNVPSNVKVALVASEAFAGKYTRNPFNFHHFSCNFAGLYLDGKPVTSRPFEPNFSEDQYSGAYQALSLSSSSHQIERSQFSSGYAIYNFEVDAIPNQHVGKDIVSMPKTGHMRLDMRFGGPDGLGESVVVVVYAKFPSQIRIDESRAILF